LTDGLEIDVKKTLNAWQCPGYDDPIKLWVEPVEAVATEAAVNEPAEVA
jgi:hypothetical protein